jgi:hypothetical protein
MGLLPVFTTFGTAPGAIEVSNSGEVAGCGHGEVANVDSDGVGAGQENLEASEGRSGECGEVLGVTEAEAWDNDGSASGDVDVAVGDAVDQVDANVILCAGGACWQKNCREHRDEYKKRLLHCGTPFRRGCWFLRHGWLRRMHYLVLNSVSLISDRGAITMTRVNNR